MHGPMYIKNLYSPLCLHSTLQGEAYLYNIQDESHTKEGLLLQYFRHYK